MVFWLKFEKIEGSFLFCTVQALVIVFIEIEEGLSSIFTVRALIMTLLRIITSSFFFRKQVSSSAYGHMPEGLDPDDDVELVRLDTQFRNLFGSKVWNSSTLAESCHV